jgi:hypothetical protein
MFTGVRPSAREVPVEKLMSADFSDVLGGPLGDPDRYRRVERKIEKAKTPLQVAQEERERFFKGGCGRTEDPWARSKGKVREWATGAASSFRKQDCQS